MFEGPPNPWEASPEGVQTLSEEELAKKQEAVVTEEELKEAMADLGIHSVVEEAQKDLPEAYVEESVETPAPIDVPNVPVQEPPSVDTETLPVEAPEAHIESTESDPLPEPQIQSQEEVQRYSSVGTSRGGFEPAPALRIDYDRMHGNIENIRQQVFGTGLRGLLNFMLNPKAWARYRQMMREHKNDSLANKTYTKEYF